MSTLKRIFKRNSHNFILKPLAGFGRAVNRLYENRNHDIFSNGELTVLEKLSGIGPEIIIDGGANVGNYSLLINKTCPGSKVYAFEPVKSTFDKLVQNTRAFEKIVPVNKGLLHENCTKEINLYSADEYASLFEVENERYGAGLKEEISLIRGDDFIKETGIKSIDLLKLDLEGAEYDALLGFDEALRGGIIKAVQFEYGYINITTKKLLVDYYNLFEKYGYIVGKIFPKIVEFRKYSYVYEDFLGPNFLAVKASETDLIELFSKKIDKHGITNPALTR